MRVCVQVLNGQRKYQIRLKSTSGPIEVLLVNKDPSSAAPVVLPVPPPDDILHSLPAPTATQTTPQAPKVLTSHWTGNTLEKVFMVPRWTDLGRPSPLWVQNHSSLPDRPSTLCSNKPDRFGFQGNRIVLRLQAERRILSDIRLKESVNASNPNPTSPGQNRVRSCSRCSTKGRCCWLLALLL